MNASHRLLAAALTIGFAAFSASAASFTTVDISSYVNANLAFNPQTYPIGTTIGNANTGIPFDTATYHGLSGSWIANNSSAGILDVKLDVSGQASFYALLNNYNGTPGADEYDITLEATNGDSVTYQSIGGVNTRDYNAAFFTNTIASTTIPWFNNGIGQRLDLREFNLPNSFASDTISDFIITQRVPFDAALFTGLTFSTTPYTATPEPLSFPLCPGGLLTFAALRFCAQRVCRQHDTRQEC